MFGGYARLLTSAIIYDLEPSQPGCCRFHRSLLDGD